MKCLILSLCVVAVCNGIIFAKETAKKQVTPAPASAYSTPDQTTDSGTGSNERIALGFNAQLSNNGVNSVAFRHWGPRKNGIEWIVGYSKDDNNNFLDLGAKLLHCIKREQHLMAYSFGLIGIEKYTIKSFPSDLSDTNTTIAGGFGVEFFFQELPNLGLGAEVGFGYNSGTKQLGTIAGWLPTVGIRYYYK